MPNLTSSAATLRGGGYSYKGYLAVVPQTIVCTAQVTTTPSFPALSLAINVTAGNIADVRRGMTVRVETVGGVFKGLLRVASAGTLNATTLPVNEVAAGTVNVAANDVLKIAAEYRIWDKLVSATAALNKDSRIAYSAQLSDPPPVANAGGAAVGWGASADIAFNAAASFAVDPDNTSNSLTYSWDFVDGTPSTSTSAAPTVTFPAGFRWVALTVTDAVNGQSTTKYVPVWVFDFDTLSPTEVIVSSLEGEARAGWRASFELVDSGASISALPDGALVVYVEREFYNGVEQSFGSGVSGRSSIKFVGYLVQDTITVEPGSDAVRFEAVGPLGILERTPALPQLLISKNAPSNWQEVKSLNVQRALWYLYHWQTTVGTIFDTLAVDGGALGNLSLLRMAVTDVSSAAGQLRDVASATNLIVSCDRLGRLTFVREFDYLSDADRNARVKTFDINADDVMALEIPREHRANVKFVRGEGFTTSGAPVFSNAPGNAPAPFGPQPDTLSRQIVNSQADLNTRTGLHFAKVNALFNGQFVPRGVQATLPDGYDVFEPAYCEAVTLTLDASANKRGISFGTGTRWTVPRVSVTHDVDAGGKTVRLTLDHETRGPAGVTYVPPAAADISISLPALDIGYELPGIALDYNTSRTTAGVGTIALFADDGTLYRTSDFSTPESAGGPTWSALDLTTYSAWSGTLLQFVVDAYSPKYVSGTGAVNGWLLTTTRIIRITDIFGTPALAARYTFLVTTGSGASARRIAATRGAQNHVVVGSNYGNHATYPGVWVTYTTDDSAYTEVQVTQHYNTQPRFDIPWVWISERESGVVYVPAYENTASFNSAVVKLYKSANFGATWAVSSGNLAFTTQYVLPRIAMPFSIGTANIMYRGDVFRVGLNDVYKMFRVTGSVNTDISPYFAPDTYNFTSITIDDNNANNAIFAASGNASKLLRTTTLGYTAPVYQDVTSLAFGNVLAGAGQQVYVEGAGNLYYTSDFGLTWDNRKGNIVTTASFVGLCGG